MATSPSSSIEPNLSNLIIILIAYLDVEVAQKDFYLIKSGVKIIL